MNLRSGSQRYRHFVGFFNLLIRLFRETAPFSRLKITTRWGYGGRILDLTPRRHKVMLFFRTFFSGCLLVHFQNAA